MPQKTNKTAARSFPIDEPALASQEMRFITRPSGVYLFGGSTASDIGMALAERFPEVEDRLLAIDSARPTANGEGPADPPPWQLLLLNRDVKKLARSRSLRILDDGLIPHLEYPESVADGAAEVRLFGMIKFAEAIPAVRRRIRRLIGEALRETNGMPLNVVITASICGGTGSPLIMPLSLLAHDEARRIAPGATVTITVLGIQPSFFLGNSDVQQSDRERLRLEANAAATLREIKYLQTPGNSRRLQEALGINPAALITIPPLESLYQFGSESNGRTLTREKLFDRLLATALSLTHPTVSEIDKAMMSNAKGQYCGMYCPPEQAIIAAAADRSAWLPPAMRDLYVLSLQAEGFMSALRKTETAQIEGLMRKFKARLGLEAIEADIQQVIDGITVSEKVTVDPQFARLPDREALRHLTDIFEYFKAEVTPQLVATARSKAREVEAVLIPDAVQGVSDALLAEVSSLDAGREVCEALVRQLTEDGNNLNARLQQIKRSNFTGRLQAELEQLKGGAFSKLFDPARRTRAAEACEHYKRATIENLVIQLKERAYRSFAARFQAFATEFAAREGQLRERLAEIKGRQDKARRAAAAVNDVLCSIVRPEEIDAFLQRVTHGIGALLGESSFTLTPTRLMQPGLDEFLAEHTEEAERRYVTFLRSQLKSLSGAAAFARLKFSLADWVQGVARDLVPPVAFDFLPIGGEGNAATHQYLAGGGEEFLKLKEVKAASTKLRAFNVVDSGDPFFVTARLRFAGLPFTVLQVAEYEAAAEQFEAEDQTKAVNVLGSSGWIAPAQHEKLRAAEPVISVAPGRFDDRGVVAHANSGSNDGHFMVKS